MAQIKTSWKTSFKTSFLKEVRKVTDQERLLRLSVEEYNYGDEEMAAHFNQLAAGRKTGGEIMDRQELLRKEFSRQLIKKVAHLMAEDGSPFSITKAEKVVEAVLDHLKNAAIAIKSNKGGE